MGRITFEGLGKKPLPKRNNIILTSDPKNFVKLIKQYSNLSFLSEYHSLIEKFEGNQNEHLFVIGGKRVFSQFLPYAEYLSVSTIEKEYEGDTYFPSIDFLNNFRLKKECLSKDFSIRIYERILLNKKTALTENQLNEIFYRNFPRNGRLEQKGSNLFGRTFRKGQGVNFVKYPELLFSFLDSFEKIALYTHISPDPDALGSQLGLKEIIENNWKDKIVYLDDSTKVMSPFLVIVTDTATVERINGKGWDMGKKIVKIDHHSNVNEEKNYYDYYWVDKSSPACCQLIAEWAEAAKLKIGKKAAEFLLWGIIGDTKKFTTSSVTSKTFRIVAMLMKEGNIKNSDFYRQFFPPNLSECEMKLRGFLLLSFKKIGRLGYTSITSKDFTNFKCLKRDDVFSHLHIFDDAQFIDAYIVFVTDGVTESGKIRASIRSKKCPVDKIAKKYGGGGHKFAAGARIENLADQQKMLDDLAHFVNNK